MFNEDEFIQYVLYISNKFADLNLYLTETKLYKILWFSNLRYADKYGALLIQDVFIKEPYGPVPEIGQEFIQSIIKSDTKTDGNIKITISFWGEIFNQKKSHKIEPVKKWDNDYISQNQKEVFDEIIKEYGNLNSKNLSDITHLNEAWKSGDDWKAIDITKDMTNENFKDIVAEEYNENIVLIKKIRYTL
ncbi:MAG: Panacea domain-containing protein [Candidatus Gracilibacteria bacterium]|nr:Panacea domain-containing protein [Candidatus Gracilibacteria bacterium]